MTAALLDDLDLDRELDAALPCRAAREDLWFSDQPADLERAKGLCADCPIRRSCLVGALERGEY